MRKNLHICKICSKFAADFMCVYVKEGFYTGRTADDTA